MFHKITPKSPGLEHTYAGPYGTVAINRPAGGGLSEYFAGFQSFGAVQIAANAALRITVPAENSNFSTSAAIITNGQIISSFPGTGAQSAFTAVDQIPSFGFLCTTAAADNKVWDNYADNTGAMHFRTLTDAGSSANWMLVQRSGGVPTSVGIFPTLQVNGIPEGTATTANSAAINTVETYVSVALSIPANALAAGNVFKLRAHGTCTSTAVSVQNFNLRLGANGNTSDTLLNGSLPINSAGAGTSVPFFWEAYITVRSIGSSGSIHVESLLINAGGGASPTGVSNGATQIGPFNSGDTTINTTGALKLGLSFVSAAATTTTTFDSVIFQRVTE